MNKTLYYSALLNLIFFCSCTPKPEISYDKIPSQKVSIAYLKSLFKGYAHQINEDIYIEGLIVSSDRCRNFYKTVVIEDMTGAIEVKIDMQDVFTLYKSGLTIRVRCNSLVLADYGGLIQLGAKPSGAMTVVENIAPELITSFLSVTSAMEQKIVPHTVTIPSLSVSMLSRPVAFESVQFVEQEIRLPWCDSYVDTDRHMVNRQGDTLIVRTRGDATFADRLLPGGSGRIEGILSYFNRSYQLKVVDNYNVFMNSERF